MACIVLNKVESAKTTVVTFLGNGPETCEMRKHEYFNEGNMDMIDSAKVIMPKWQAFDMMMELRQNGFV